MHVTEEITTRYVISSLQMIVEDEEINRMTQTLTREEAHGTFQFATEAARDVVQVSTCYTHRLFSARQKHPPPTFQSKCHTKCPTASMPSIIAYTGHFYILGTIRDIFNFNKNDTTLRPEVYTIGNLIKIDHFSY